MTEIDGPAEVSFGKVLLGVTDAVTVVAEHMPDGLTLAHLFPEPQDIRASVESLRRLAVQQTGYHMDHFLLSHAQALELDGVTPPPVLLPCDWADPTFAALLRAWGNAPWDEARKLVLADRLEEAGFEGSAKWLRGFTPWSGWRNANHPACTRTRRRAKLKTWREFLRRVFHPPMPPF